MPLKNLLVQKNGDNMLLQGICVYNYNQICDVLQIKTMTERYDDRSPQTISLKLPQHLQQLSIFFVVQQLNLGYSKKLEL